MVRCKVKIARIEAFRACYLSRGAGLCFLAHPDVLAEGTGVEISLAVLANRPVALSGVVQRSDFDEEGTPGVLVELSTESVQKVAELDASLPDPAHIPSQMLSAAITSVEAEPLAGVDSSTERLRLQETLASLREAEPVAAPPVSAKPMPAPGVRLPSISAQHAVLVVKPVESEALPPLALTPALTARFGAAREAALRSGARKGVFVYAEVVGAERESCLVRALEALAAMDGFIDTRDGGGVLVGFVNGDEVPIGRAAAAMLRAREAVVEEAATQATPVTFRAALVGGELQSSGPVLSVHALERAHSVRALLQPGQVGCERALEVAVGQVFELSTPVGDVVPLAGPLPARPPSTELVGRKPMLEAIDRRLTQLAEPGVGLMIRGGPGAGLSTVAVAIAELGRKRELAVSAVTASPWWKDVPGAGLAALACATVGVPFEHRASRLRPALEALALPGPFLEAITLATQLAQNAWPCTTGQAVHALRALFHSQAKDRPVLLVVDGLEHLDALTLDTLAELARRPLARELTIGLASATFPLDRFEGVATAALPELTGPEVAQLVALTLGSAPGPKLAAHLEREGHGRPGEVVDWLMLLGSRGALALRNGAVELVDAVPVPGAGVLRARVELLPSDTRGVLEAAWCQGETFDPAFIPTLLPRVTRPTMQRIPTLRLMSVTPHRRWAFSSPRVREVIGELASKERPALMERLAVALAQQTGSPNVDLVELGRAWIAAGQGAKAEVVFTQAVDAALLRRAPRDAAVALRDLSRAQSRIHTRLDSLSAAVSCSLAAADVPFARTLTDEAVRVAQTTQAETAELMFALAKLARIDGRLEHAGDLLERAELLAGGTPFETLLFAERGDLAELRGSPDVAVAAFTSGIETAAHGGGVARRHGEVDLVARVEGRLGALAIARQDPVLARQHFERSADRWRAAKAWPAFARALSNVASACAQGQDLEAAVKSFGAAAEAARDGGDFLFQARALLGQARALKRLGRPLEEVKGVAGEAWKLATAVGWSQGRADAEALVKG